MYKEQFSARLKAARERTGFSQRDIAREINISQPSLALYETGKREPDIETLGKLAEYYGISIDWLFGLGTQGSRPNYDQVSPQQKKAV